MSGPPPRSGSALAQCANTVNWEVVFGRSPDDYTHVCSDHLSRMLGNVYEEAKQNKMTPSVSTPQTSEPQKLKCCYIEDDEELAALFLKINKLENQNEQLRLQLAGCSVAAVGSVKGENDCKRGAYGWSVALEDVKRLYLKYNQCRIALMDIERVAASHPVPSSQSGEHFSWIVTRAQNGLKPLPEA